MLWDRRFWAADGDPAKALRKGELRFTLAGEKLQGSWVLVRLRHDRERGKRTNWLLIKRHDGYEREGAGDDILSQEHSVASGRSMEEIAGGKGRHPKPFMLGKANSFKANAIWHSNRDNDAPSKKESAIPIHEEAAEKAEERNAFVHIPAAVQERKPPALRRRLGLRDQARWIPHAAACGGR